MKRRKSHRKSASEIRDRAMRQRARHTPEELRDIALKIHRNEIFTSRHCYNPQEVQQCFPILGMLDDRDAKRVARRVGKRGLIFEDFSKRMPLGVNGLPMFLSMKILTGAEHQIVRERMDRLRKAEQEALA